MDISFRVGLWLLLSIAVPSTFLAVPLYLRHKMYSESRSAVVSSDFRVMEEQISTIWCEGIRLEMNTTFNAYLLRHSPRFENMTRTYWTTKHFNLRRGEREFWGFFLPKGSTLSVSSCARFESAKITLVKGKRVMQRCIRPGYINSDEADSAHSSDEDEEYSSWSSSEEATDELKCMHTLLNRTLTPSLTCTTEKWIPKDIISYTTPESDYYYIVFANMNSFYRSNDIFAKLMLNKVVYDVRTFIRKCFNMTRCTLPFSFNSDEHVILEVPDRSLWVADIVLSVCQPRTMIYFPFYVAVPITILIFAFRGNKRM